HRAPAPSRHLPFYHLPSRPAAAETTILNCGGKLRYERHVSASSRPIHPIRPIRPLRPTRPTRPTPRFSNMKSQISNPHPHLHPLCHLPFVIPPPPDWRPC